MKKDGGPAFPRPAVDDRLGWIGAQQGMSLRDYFAAMTLQGIFASSENGPKDSNAKDAYEQADAMLKERDK